MGGEGSENGERTLSRAVAELVERLGYECVNVGVKTDSARIRLQILIDSLGGINVRDCETVSKSVNRFLDEEDFPELSGHYYLEVSSPGVERPLFTPEQYARFKGREARLRLAEPLEGRKTLTGVIEEVDGECVGLFVEAEERSISVPFRKIKSGSLVFRGLEPEVPQGKPKGGKKRRRTTEHREGER